MMIQVGKSETLILPSTALKSNIYVRTEKFLKVQSSAYAAALLDAITELPLDEDLSLSDFSTLNGIHSLIWEIKVLEPELLDDPIMDAFTDDLQNVIRAIQRRII